MLAVVRGRWSPPPAWATAALFPAKLIVFTNPAAERSTLEPTGSANDVDRYPPSFALMSSWASSAAAIPAAQPSPLLMLVDRPTVCGTIASKASEIVAS